MYNLVLGLVAIFAYNVTTLTLNVNKHHWNIFPVDYLLTIWLHSLHVFGSFSRVDGPAMRQQQQNDLLVVIPNENSSCILVPLQVYVLLQGSRASIQVLINSCCLRVRVIFFFINLRTNH